MFAESEARVLRRWASGDDELRAWTARRVAGEPLEQVVGRVEFDGLTLEVGAGAFVPRQRSVLLARVAAGLSAERGGGTVVEACCGVAPIAAAVARRVPSARLVACDSDAAILELARRNVPDLEVFEGTALSGLPAELRGHVDVVAAVPPYVPTGAAGLLPREAIDHEPGDALFGGGDGLEVATVLVRDAVDWLADNGAVALELHRDQAPAAIGVASDLGYAASSVVGDDGQTAVIVAVAEGRAQHEWVRIP
ncbi:N5-glutamine methyltransferase family protein [Gordonia zhaorongruii]|uniref:N5-glutamine methyltransferase family protein n=1 Tax=Gordonia zhaorongruii TaxID=2597659 RepID=UPI001FD479C3|nr:methyltransferase [Gordonia zhaorongruii]